MLAGETALVAGATGLVGQALLQQLLQDPEYGRVVALVRRPLSFQHPKLEVRQIDFDEPVTWRHHIQGHALFICLGTTMKQAGSKEAFYKVDAEYVINLAQAAAHNGVPRVAVISAMGADKYSLFYYNRVKGVVEERLRAMNLNSLYLIRPSLLAGQRAEDRLGERVANAVAQVLRPIIPDGYKPITADEVARAMIVTVKEGKPGTLVITSDRLVAAAQRSPA